VTVVPIPAYRRRPTPLHAARAGASTAYCAALCLVAVLYETPVVLAAALGATVLAGAAAGVGGELRRAALLGVPLAVLFVAVNGLTSRSGETVLLRGGEVFGWRLDVTLEALAYGAVSGLRVLVVILALGLYSAVVDPDETLRMVRRVSYRSALTVSLATRLVPVLARDAARMGEAARCRSAPPGRSAVARAALRGSLDRAVEVAAALELRGYAGARRPPRSPAPWSRHDVRVAGTAIAIAGTVVAGRLLGAGHLEAYPRFDAAVGPPEVLLCVALLGLALAPFAGASAKLGVARA
jgi:energy-coupling factor transport system permease protein